MADFSNIIQEINADINTNGSRQITGAKLNQVLRDMIAAVNAAKQDPLTIDATPTAGSTNPVQSGGVYWVLSNLIANGGLYGGVVGPSDSPTYGDDYRYCYLALQAGRYSNFNNYEVDSNALLFYWLGNNWGYISLWNTGQFINFMLGLKADKVDGATQGNLAELDSEGNPTDSGIAAGDVATTEDLADKQDVISDLATIRSGAALGATSIQSSEKGVASGVATLDSGGKVPQSQLPSYVDDVLEYANLASFPATGESGKIYVALDTNKTYRWSGSAYVEIAQGLALGETSSTAFAGDRGKAIEDKIPSNASSSNKLATTADLPTIDNTIQQGSQNPVKGAALYQMEEQIYNTITASVDSLAEGKLDVPATAGTSGQVLTSDGQGGQSWQTPTSGGITDVTVGGTSVVSGGVAVVPAIPTVPIISTDIALDATSDTKTTSPKAVKTFVENKGYGTYSKPSGGIPASDLASGVIPNSVVNATSQQDGTVVLTKVNGDTITIDLNHVHPQYYSKEAETTQPSGGMLPDVIYKLGTLTGATTFSFAVAVSGNLNHYYFVFTSGSTAVVPTWPASITSWDGNCVDSTTHLPVIAASKTYEVSVIDGLAMIKEW